MHDLTHMWNLKNTKLELKRRVMALRDGAAGEEANGKLVKGFKVSAGQEERVLRPIGQRDGYSI